MITCGEKRTLEEEEKNRYSMKTALKQQMKTGSMKTVLCKEIYFRILCWDATHILVRLYNLHKFKLNNKIIVIA